MEKLLPLYVGIDLAMNSTGIAFLQNNKIVTKTLKMLPFLPQNIESNKRILQNEILEVIKKSNITFGELKFGIELSNFGNANFTNKVHFYAGMLYALIKSVYNFAEIKFYNANIWMEQLLLFTRNLTPLNNISSEMRKKIAYSFIKETFKKECANFDESDAACIAFFYEKAQNTIDLNNFNKHLKKEKKEKKESKKKLLLKLKSKEIQLKSKIVDYEIKSRIKTLTKAQTNKLNNLKIEYSQLLGEINEISKK